MDRQEVSDKRKTVARCYIFTPHSLIYHLISVPDTFSVGSRLLGPTFSTYTSSGFINKILLLCCISCWGLIRRLVGNLTSMLVRHQLVPTAVILMDVMCLVCNLLHRLKYGLIVKTFILQEQHDQFNVSRSSIMTLATGHVAFNPWWEPSCQRAFIKNMLLEGIQGTVAFQPMWFSALIVGVIEQVTAGC